MLRRTQIGLFILGLIISIYLLISYSVYNGVLICPTGGCDEVAISPYSKIGSMPVPLIGVIGYVLLINLNVFKYRLLLNSSLIIGLLFSLYLLIVSIFIIKAVCFWCTLSFLIILLASLIQIKISSNVFRLLSKKSYL